MCAQALNMLNQTHGASADALLPAVVMILVRLCARAATVPLPRAVPLSPCPT